MNSFRVRQLLATRMGMFCMSALMCALLLYFIFVRTLNLYAILFVVGISIVFGVAMSLAMHKKAGSLVVANMSEEQFNQRRRFSKLLKRGQIPKKDSEIKDYSAYIDEMDKFVLQSEAMGYGTYIPFMIVSLPFVIFERGITVMRVLAIAAIIIFTFAFFSTRRTSKKLAKIKSKLTARSATTPLV